MLFHPEQINQVWSNDFMSERLWDGSKIRLLMFFDGCNREVLWIETDTSLPDKRVIRVLKESLLMDTTLLVDKSLQVFCS
ncbi:MAG: hypothetical protein ABI763_06900 [Bacteroidota bacterium]